MLYLMTMCNSVKLEGIYNVGLAEELHRHHSLTVMILYQI